MRLRGKQAMRRAAALLGKVRQKTAGSGRHSHFTGNGRAQCRAGGEGR